MLVEMKQENGIEIYRNHFIKDFPEEERKWITEEKFLDFLKTKIWEAFIYQEEGKAKAYVIWQTSTTNHCLLIMFLAVLEPYRGQGIGTKFMQELQQEKFQDMEAVFLEVEIPDKAKNEKEKKIREKRIQFYERLGFQIRTNIEYQLFQVPFFLMVWSEHKKMSIIEDIKLVEQVKQMYQRIPKGQLQIQIK